MTPSDHDNQRAPYDRVPGGDTNGTGEAGPDAVRQRLISARNAYRALGYSGDVTEGLPGGPPRLAFRWDYLALAAVLTVAFVTLWYLVLPNMRQGPSQTKPGELTQRARDEPAELRAPIVVAPRNESPHIDTALVEPRQIEPRAGLPGNGSSETKPADTEPADTEPRSDRDPGPEPIARPIHELAQAAPSPRAVSSTAQATNRRPTLAALPRLPRIEPEPGGRALVTITSLPKLRATSNGGNRKPSGFRVMGMAWPSSARTKAKSTVDFGAPAIHATPATDPKPKLSPNDSTFTPLTRKENHT